MQEAFLGSTQVCRQRHDTDSKSPTNLSAAMSPSANMTLPRANTTAPVAVAVERIASDTVAAVLQHSSEQSATPSGLRRVYHEAAREVAPPRTTCLKCGMTCSSRTALFAHLREKRHGVITRPASATLYMCERRPCSEALRHWRSLHPHEQRRVAREVDDAGRTALHFLVSRAVERSASVVERQAAVHLILELVQCGADARYLSRPDVMWEEMPELASFQASTPLQMARSGTVNVTNTVKATLGIVQDTPLEKCSICLDEYVQCCDQLFELSRCGHRCCRDGFRNWLLVQIGEGATFETMSCPVGLCSIAEADLFEVLGKQSMEQLQRQSLELLLSTMPGFVWCPQCPSGGLLPEEPCDDVECSRCKYHFCRHCKGNWAAHMGLSCSEFQESGAASVATWLDENTRACPKCSVRIELTTGCSHMTCRQCRHQFCWLCLGSYNGSYTMTPERQLRRAVAAAKDDNSVRCPCGNEVIGFRKH